MRRHVSRFILGLGIVLVASSALAQGATTATQPPASTSRSVAGTFESLSPGGQKIATALCGAQPGGCPSSAMQTPSSSTPPPTLTRDQIAAMKAHRGWGEIFKQMQQQGQIPPNVKNLGQLVSGRYRSTADTSGTITITTASGKSQVVGTSGSYHGSGHAVDGSAGSGAGGGHSSSGGIGKGHDK